MNVLNGLLGKLGVKYEDLNEEERRTFNAMRDSLSGRKLTDKDVEKYFDTELAEVTKKISNPENSKELDMFLKMKIGFIIKTKEFLDSPKIEKMMVEDRIKQQL